MWLWLYLLYMNWRPEPTPLLGCITFDFSIFDNVNNVFKAVLFVHCAHKPHVNVCISILLCGWFKEMKQKMNNG